MTTATKTRTSDEKKEAKPLGFQSLFTRDLANDGVKVELSFPDGKDSGFWILVAGIDSDVYRKGKTKLMRFAISLSGKNDEESEDLYQLEIIKRTAACIIDWNLIDDDGSEWPINDSNRFKLLRQAPQIADKIDDVITSRSLYVKKK
tara:strand:- start:1229 stop:1669 length:441 start_codon:yes stop_codon:yes gene_type:complete